MRSNTTTSTKKQTTSASDSRSQGANQVTVIGRLVATPSLRQTATGKHFTTARIAVPGKSRTDFFDLVLWGQLAHFATTYLGKGSLVYVEARIQSRQWKATDGSTRHTVEIVASRLQALSKNAEAVPAA